MKKRLTLLHKTFFVSALLLCMLQSAFAKTTPTEVYIEANALKNAMAEEVNKRVGASLLPILAIDLEGAKPRHVLALSFALNKKLGIYMKNNGISGFKQGAFPEENIKPAHVKALLETAQENFLKIAPNTSYKRVAVSNKKPADVMKEITFLNLWIDILLQGKVSPAYPFNALEHIETQLLNDYEAFGVEVPKLSPRKHANITPKEVFMNGVNFYEALALYDHVRFGSTNPTHPYNILSSKTKVTPAHVYTLTIFNLYYLYSVQKKLDFAIETTNPALRSGIKPNDVYQKYDRVNTLLLYLIGQGK